MARRSILSSVRDEAAQAATPRQEARPPGAPPARDAPSDRGEARAAIRPSRIAKLHVGGYFDPLDPVVMAFQKLKVDLRRSQQDMLLEALADFVAKNEAAEAFRPAGRRKR